MYLSNLEQLHDIRSYIAGCIIVAEQNGLVIERENEGALSVACPGPRWEVGDPEYYWTIILHSCYFSEDEWARKWEAPTFKEALDLAWVDIERWGKKLVKRSGCRT